MMLDQLLTDERAAVADKQIRAAMKKAGTVDEMAYYLLRSRVAVQAGELQFVLYRGYVDERFGPPRQHGAGPDNRTGEWIQAVPVTMPLEAGLALWFSPENPECELERRRFVVAEEQRQMELNSARQLAAEISRRQAEEKENARRERWRHMTPSARAIARVSPDVAVIDFAKVLATEESGRTDPPTDWQ
jgi:hypothetical protein